MIPEGKERDLPKLCDPAVWHRNLFPRQAGPDALHVWYLRPLG